MIPKKIHYCWFGMGAKSELNNKCLESWHKLLPDFQIKEWNETNSPFDNAYCRAASTQESWAKLSNHVRLHALYTEGGIYLDTDVEVLKNFAPLLRHKCFLGFQQKEEQVDWVNNAVVGAEPGHQFLKRCMEVTEQLHRETGELYRSPTVVTRVLKEMGLREYGLQEIKEVTIYPVDYFYPYPWFSRFSSDCITENTYCIHYWEWSWKKKHGKALALSRVMKRMMRPFISKIE
jgi:mannosyltransferase OCH1-like enzyme